MTPALTALCGHALAAVAAPIVFYQGAKARREIPRLPEAQGPRQGVAKAGKTRRRLIAIGDSTTVGVGAERMQDALPAQLANSIARETGDSVNWRTAGANGARIADVVRQLEQLGSPDVTEVLVSVGVNDAKGMTSLAAWRKNLRTLTDQLNALPSRPRVIFAGIPPIHKFPALTAPLSLVLGARATALEAISLKMLQAETHVRYLPVNANQPAEFMAADGFHPSAWGYQRWASSMVDSLSDWLRGAPNGEVTS